jgi:hypothetical protein
MSNNSNYEDERYLYFSQREMNMGKGALATVNERSHALEFAQRSDTSTYIYELVEVVIPRACGEEAPEDSEQKRPIKVTYV